MTNKNRQEQLDKQKWLHGEKSLYDPSGSMKYCSVCQYQTNGICSLTHEERVEDTVCAKAYNKMFKNR